MFIPKVNQYIITNFGSASKNKMKRVLLFTHFYPYGTTEESFISNEVKYLLQPGVHLTIVPYTKRAGVRDIPQGVTVDDLLTKKGILQLLSAFIRSIFSPYLFLMLSSGEKRRVNLFKYLYQGFKAIIEAHLVKNYLKNISCCNDPLIIYSYWFNHTVLGAVIAKQTGLISAVKIVSRAHGYDVYEELRGKYYPLRDMCLRQIDALYVVSLNGATFLQSRYPAHKEKIFVSRLGIDPAIDKSCKKEETVSFISCSQVNQVKRVHLIYSSILGYAAEHPQKKITWSHIGNGVLFNSVQKMVRDSCLSNLNVKLYGEMSNSEVRDLMSNKYFHVFINLSLSEGVPVSIMEAISAGIPVLATETGGNPEIVTSRSGICIPLMFGIEQFIDAINSILDKGDSLRISAREFFLENYEAGKNYTNFVNELLS